MVRFVNALRKYEVYFREASQTSYKPTSSFTTEKASDDNSCQMFGHDRNWQLIETATSLISRAIPFAMKVGVVRNGDGRFVLIAQNNDFDAKSLEVREPAAVILLQILDREAPLFRASVPLGDTTWLLEPLAATVEDPIRLRIDSLTQGLSTSILSDISDLPNELKSAPRTLLAT
ncbi:unnamed protein product, partial [Mesorhabditis belari]|uniref:Uncharacterized protein n=1 Tax=Mesorhabditis belari TaxID=2138241 RepID=A0AAF3EZK6_9BILA